MTEARGFYDSTYGGFGAAARRRVRTAAFGEDVGQNSWMTGREWRGFLDRLAVGENTRLLDVACGSGGPALFAARARGARVTGVDVSEAAIAAATEAVRAEGLDGAAHYVRADCELPLPFPDASFDAVVCVDAVNHLRPRGEVLTDWARLLRPGGRVLFTDPVLVTGLVTGEEIAARASIGTFVFSSPEANRDLVRAAGLELLEESDLTAAVASVAGRWHAARERERDALVTEEGEQAYEDFQRFFATVGTLAGERRLSRHLYLAQRAG